jgi:hypothetical protein
MNAREGRIIMLGLVSGAALGGIAVLYMRMRDGQSGSEATRALAKDINWAELLSLGIAAIGLARRIGALSESSEDAEAHES